MPLAIEVFRLLVLAVPVACIAWTITHEEIFREAREFCQKKSVKGRRWWVRKFFYMFTCEYCLSHYVALGAVLITGERILFDDWRGLGVSIFSLVWVANHYMSLFARLRLDVKRERIAVEHEENA